MSKKVTFKTASGEDGSLTAEGGDPQDNGPAGAVLRLMIGILKGDVAECRKEMSANTPAEAGPPTPPSSHATVTVGKVTYEGDALAVVPTDTLVGEENQSLPFVTVKEGGAWKVDMGQTMERMMGPMMEAMTEGMKQVGEAMGAAMQAIGEGLNEALGGGRNHDDEPEMKMDDEMPAEVQKPKKKKKASKRR